MASKLGQSSGDSHVIDNLINYVIYKDITHFIMV